MPLNSAAAHIGEYTYGASLSSSAISEARSSVPVEKYLSRLLQNLEHKLIGEIEEVKRVKMPKNKNVRMKISPQQAARLLELVYS